MTEERLQELENQQQSPEQQKQFEYITELEKSKQEVFKHLTESVPKGWNEEIKKYVNEELEIITTEYRRISSDQAERERFCERFKLSQKKFETIGIIEFGKLLEKYNRNTSKGKSIIQVRRPKTLNLINDNYTNNVLLSAMNTDKSEFTGQFKPTGKKEISFFTISTVDDTALNLRNVSEYDKHLHNIIGSFIDTGQTAITLDSLCRMVIDKDDAGGTNISQRVYLWERLQEQAKLFQTFELENGKKFHGNMISFQAIEDPAENEPIGNITIQFKAYPILYLHAHERNQLIPVPLKLLKIYDAKGKRAYETPERIAIKSYLLRRVAIITKNNPKSNMKSNRILFNTVFDECEITVDRRHKADYIKYIELILNNWKAQNFIQGYAIIKDGRSKTGVEINPKIIE